MKHKLSNFAVLFSIFIISVIGYLTFVALQGDNGLLRLLQIEVTEERLSAEFAEVLDQRVRMANRVASLSGPVIDLDLLDEQARLVLSLGKEDEVVLH